ncbi:Short-chain dehydrogenase TIC 32, chloroplastic [Symbiodinium microadriaticum]|uniref:Short-chain dehydrogenase TIC 32, chloroplastic n=1 Tax=Symbiodinium microadriaticum TaxID=2951 RepID=A0A1Q9D2Y1_SYMMI|nr:Short-chain dehydrogenase TIC 32, chloroplastic [Symbiodinium microadriaticum]
MTRLDWRSSKALAGHGQTILEWNVATETAAPGYTSHITDDVGFESIAEQSLQDDSAKCCKALLNFRPLITVPRFPANQSASEVNLLLPDLLQLEAVGKQPKVVVLGSNICYAHDVFDFSELVCAADPSMRDVFLAKPYSLFRAYGQSKLANLMMCRQLAWRLRQRGSRILVNCVHPGEVLTQVFNDFHPVVLTLYAALRPLAQLFFKTPAMGAVCTTFVAASPSVQVSGEYFMRCRIAKAPEACRLR